MLQFFDVTAVRGQFPVTKNMLYLDSARQSPLAGCVRDALYQFYAEAQESGGPKSVWLRRAERTRERVANFLNASPNEIAFTKNTSEGLNIAANAVPLKRDDNVLIIEGDHPNNAYAWLNLKRIGVEVRVIGLANNDVATADTFAPYIDEHTRVISLSHVTFHAGQRHDIASIGALCNKKRIYLVVDATQSVGVVSIDVKQLGISVLATGCHKGMLVPQGLGFLYVKDGMDDLKPAYLAMAGLAHPPADFIARPYDLELRNDARRFEIGNYNLPNLHALSASIDLISSIGVDKIENHVLALGDRLIEHMDEQGIRLVGPRNRQNRSHIYVFDLPNEQWFEYFTQNKVRVSPQRGGIRISFALFNTLEEVDKVAELIHRRETCQ